MLGYFWQFLLRVLTEMLGWPWDFANKHYCIKFWFLVSAQNSYILVFFEKNLILKDNLLPEDEVIG